MVSSEVEEKSLSEIDWLHDKESLFAWNTLHAPKIGKVRNFTFVQKSGIHDLIERVKMCPKWAYIKHDKDITDDGIHYHFYIEFANPRSFNSVANDLGIPVTSLQKVLNKRGILEYLTHKNEANKHHYNDDEVVTNMNVETEIKDTKPDIFQEFQDLLDYKTGKITWKQYLDKYQYTLCDISYFARFKTFDRMTDIETGAGNGGTCPPFRVPSSKPPP